MPMENTGVSVEHLTIHRLMRMPRSFVFSVKTAGSMKTIINGKIYINTEYKQIINGEEIDLPSPKSIHQLAMGKLLPVLYDHVEAHQLGEMYRVPFDVIFEENVNVLQPDFLFISRQNESIVQDDVRGIPDLVIEVVSSEMLNIDTVIKRVSTSITVFRNAGWYILRRFTSKFIRLMTANIHCKLRFPAVSSCNRKY